MNYGLMGYSQEVPSYYDTLDADHVLVFELDKSICPVSKIFLDKNMVSKCFVLKKELNKKQTQKLLKLVNCKETYGNPPLSCSTTQIGVVFYKQDNIAGYISLSFDCNDLESDKPLYGNEFHKISSGEDGYFIYSSFSDSGRRKLKAFFDGL